MRRWLAMLCKTLFPGLDHDRLTWRAEMERELLSSQRQNIIEAEYLRHLRDTHD